jgi:arginyl-tRNA synthetase
MKKALEEAVNRSLKAIGIEPPETMDIEVPKEESHGDISTPIAMALAKALKRPPRKIAEDIVRNLQGEGAFGKVEIAGPGFINFFFREGFLFAQLKGLLEKGRRFLRQDIGRGMRVQIEFVSANPTGPLHLGHGRGAAVGNALANLLEAGGYSVQREYYVNDAGLQVRLLGRSVFARYKGLLGADFPFPEDGYRGGYVSDIALRALREAGEKYKDASFEEAEEFFVELCLGMMLDEIKGSLSDFGISFDTWQSERALYRSGKVKETIEYLRGKGLIYELDGALWFRATEFGDEKDRVLLKSDGEHTYFASDIAYHRKKVEGGFGELVVVWGADHHGYIPRMKAALEALGYDREKLKVLLVQMVSLQRAGRPVQMSKRAGEYVTLREVMEEVGVDTTKFIFLTRRPDSQLVFDLEAAKEASAENPVYYVQYANARISSIFAHASEKGIEASSPLDLGLLKAPEEIRIIKKLLAYPMTFEAAVRSHEPHRITFYLQDLAGVFHPYYNQYRVVTEDMALTFARLALLRALQAVLTDGLEILGLTAPKRM